MLKGGILLVFIFVTEVLIMNNLPDFYRIKLLTKSSGHTEEQREYCFKNNLFAIGWPINDSVNSVEEYLEYAKNEYSQDTFNKLYYSYNNLNRMKINDFIWVQKDSRNYYLGQVDSEISYTDEHIHDIGLTRRCSKWKHIDFDDVPGIVTSYYAGPGKVLEYCKSINESDDIKQYCVWLYNDKNYNIAITNGINLLHYEDLEDLMGLFLQFGYEGTKYYIHPSTNKLSTKAIEYELRNESGEKFGIQCKIGKSKVNEKTLRTLINNGYRIFVCTYGSEEYNNKSITKIPINELWDWAKKHEGLLPKRIKNYINISM